MYSALLLATTDQGRRAKGEGQRGGIGHAAMYLIQGSGVYQDTYHLANQTG